VDFFLLLGGCFSMSIMVISRRNGKTWINDAFKIQRR
jgi:hypothetical protein